MNNSYHYKIEIRAEDEDEATDIIKRISKVNPEVVDWEKINKNI